MVLVIFVCRGDIHLRDEVFPCVPPTARMLLVWYTGARMGFVHTDKAILRVYHTHTHIHAPSPMCTSLSSFQYDSYSVTRSVCNPIRPSYRLRRITRRCVVKRSVAESRTCVDIHPISKKKPGRDFVTARANDVQRRHIFAIDGIDRSRIAVRIP